MSENRDEATGQFAAEPEQLFGQAAIERDAGYVPLPEDPTGDNTDELSVKDAASQLAEQRHTAESEIKTYSALDGLDENVTMTIEQGAKALNDARQADESQAELE